MTTTLSDNLKEPDMNTETHTELPMTEDEIKHMVNRFLGWKLPENFNPDGGISFERFGNKDTLHQYRREPSGTNLLDATQTDAMVRYMVEGMPDRAVNSHAALVAALRELNYAIEELSVSANFEMRSAAWGRIEMAQRAARAALSSIGGGK